MKKHLKQVLIGLMLCSILLTHLPSTVLAANLISLLNEVQTTQSDNEKESTTENVTIEDTKINTPDKNEQKDTASPKNTANEEKNGEVIIKYNIIKEEGPDHDKKFTAEVICDNKKLAKGIGKSKKQAEMEAAKNAINNL